jgi:transposase
MALLAQGFSLREVARRVWASVGSISLWRRAWRQGGEAALAPKPIPGRPRRLPDQQCTHLVKLLLQGAKDHRFTNELSTLRRIASVVQVHCGALSPRAHLKALASLGLAWSGTRTPGKPARRTGHHALEALHVARDREKPDDLETSSPSWMRAGFCSSRPTATPGRPRGIRPLLPTTTSMSGSRPWRLSPSRRSASIWACTSASSCTTFKPSMWSTSSARSCSSSGSTLSYSGTTARFTGGRPSRRCARPTPDCTSKSSRPMRRNSIPWSRCGTTPQGTSPTAYCGAPGISAVACPRPPAGSGTRRRSCGRSSVVPNSHFHRENILLTYAKLCKRSKCPCAF